MSKIRWGVLSTAKIAREKVIPAMQRGAYCEISALASRDAALAEGIASQLGVPKWHGSYDALLADPGIDAVYIPLPNHLHVTWSIRALEAGKHVLCEKPIGLDAADAERLLDASGRHPDLKVMEAFMYRFHPQWERARALTQDGAVGQVRTVHSHFCYHNVDPTNVRNRRELGGGALMDIGCYCVSLSRFLFDEEPRGVLGIIDEDPVFGTDRLTSGILDFGERTSTFTCATQLSPYQRVQIFGTEGRLEIEIPFNAPTRKRCRLRLTRGAETREIMLPVTDQYTVQGDLFSASILENGPVPTSLEDAVANMRAIDAIRTSANERTWIWLQPTP